MKQLFIILLFVFQSCHQQVKNNEQKNNPLYDQVMAIHDSVMPEMSTIHSLKRDLKAIENADKKDLVYKRIKDLDEADEAMMSWMASFKVPDDTSVVESYLRGEKEKISGISNLMFQSINDARSLLDSLQTQKVKK